MPHANLPSEHDLIARLDRLPKWPYPVSLLVIIGIGFFFSFYDITSIGLALPVIIKQFHAHSEAAAWAITSSLIGYIIGSFLDSRLSDLMGRKLALILSVTFFSVGSILSATSVNLTQLIVWRFVIGMGIGSEIASVVTYIGELSPAPLRGRITAICVWCSMLGFAFVPFVGLALVPHFTWGWRLMFVFGGIGSILVLFMRLHMPESLRWLVAKQQHHRAYKVLLNLEARMERQLGVELLPPAAQVVEQVTSKFNIIRYVVLFALIWGSYYIGNYAWLTLNTKLFTLVGFDLENSLLLVSLTSLGFVVGSALAIWVGDKLERKWLCFCINIIWTVVLLVIGWYASFSIILVFGFVAATSIGFIIPIMYTFTAEHFPTSIRATCLSITDGLGHVGGAFCGQFAFGFYYAFKNTGHGFAITFSALAMTGLLAAVLLLFSAPKTNHVLQQ